MLLGGLCKKCYELEKSSTSSDKDCLRVAMQKHCWVDKELMVNILICLCALGLTIEQQNLHRQEAFILTTMILSALTCMLHVRS